MGTGFAFCNMAIAMGQFIGPLVAGAAKVGIGWSAMTLILGISSCGVGLLSLIINVLVFLYFAQTMISISFVQRRHGKQEFWI